MIRPLLVLATVVLVILGAGAGADAAELLAPVLAQSAAASCGALGFT